METPPQKRSAFTIVELLVVISIIAVLVGLIFPALSGAQRRARKSTEVNRIRQVGVAWNLYSNANNDNALPGFLPGTGGGPGGESIQDAWRVHYRFPDKTDIPQGDAEEWTWRLLPFLDFDQDAVFGYLGLDEMSQLAMSEYGLLDPEYDFPDPMVDRPAIPRPTHLAQEPAFAYNAFYVGGWWEWTEIDDDGNPAIVARTRFANASTVPEGGGVSTRVNVVVRSASTINDSSKFILFCSAVPRPIGEYHQTPDHYPGSHYIVPPILGETDMWGFSSQNPSESVVEVFSTPGGSDTTPIPAGRYTNQVALLHADLHTEPQAPGALVDQRFWVNTADRVDFKHTE